MNRGFFSAAAWIGDRREQRTLPECGRCGLFKQCKSPKMPPSGRGKRRILVVGEAPGRTEDEEGIQFIGDSGQRLRDELRDLDCKLEDCTVTNAAICRPPGNKIENLYIDACRPNLLNAIREHKPEVVILLGASAVRGLIPADREDDLGPIARWVGWRIPSHEFNTWICPTYHPSFVIRMKNPVLDRMFKEHLRRALKKEGKPITTPTLEQLKAKVERITDVRKAKRRLEDLATKKGILAFDYEANRLKPDHEKARIYSCSFCLDGRDTFAFLWDDELIPVVSEILKKKSLKKVGQNWKMEERWTKAKLGFWVQGWFWDDMLASHVLDNRTGITGLKFQSYVRFGIADYNRVVSHFFESGADGFNKIHEVPHDDLLVYNGLDSLLEFMVFEEQWTEMGL